MDSIVVPCSVIGYRYIVVLRVEVSHEAAEATETEARAAVNAKIPERAMMVCLGMRSSGQDE